MQGSMHVFPLIESQLWMNLSPRRDVVNPRISRFSRWNWNDQHGFKHHAASCRQRRLTSRTVENSKQLYSTDSSDSSVQNFWTRTLTHWPGLSLTHRRPPGCPPNFEEQGFSEASQWTTAWNFSHQEARCRAWCSKVGARSYYVLLALLLGTTSY